MDVKESTIAFDHCDSDVNKCKEIMSSKTDRTVPKTGYYLSRALSNYIQFLRDWSSSRTTADTNLLDSPFALRIDIPEDNLGDALPTDRFKEVVQYLKISVNEHYQIQKLHIDTHLKILGDLENMAKTHFQNAATLGTLDLHITLLRAILALLTPSHPERNRPYLKLGEALILRFEHTDELHDLDSAISHYSSAHFDGVDQYFLLQGLTRCLMIRFKSNQNVADLNKAINALEQALIDLPSSHPYRYAYTLQQAISYYRDALLLCPTVSDGDLHTLQSIISSFSAALIERHEQDGIPIDGEDVVKLLQSFIYWSRIQFQRSTICSLISYHNSFWIATKNKQYSDEMLSVVRQFVKLKSSSYLKHYFALQALSTMSMARFGVSKNADDLDEAIAAYRDALHYAQSP
ncbi:hypothetical protein BDQ17DRAFT_1440315 [Cyathus striatus]|nr:hypothetical protein BDQ17DRAFT_1440315 [Cyathus striatus]